MQGVVKRYALIAAGTAAIGLIVAHAIEKPVTAMPTVSRRADMEQAMARVKRASGEHRVFITDLGPIALPRFERWLADLTPEQAEQAIVVLEEARAKFAASRPEAHYMLLDAMQMQERRMDAETRRALEDAADRQDMATLTAIHEQLDATAPPDERDAFEKAWALQRGEAIEDAFHAKLEGFLSREQVDDLANAFPVFATLVR